MKCKTPRKPKVKVETTPGTPGTPASKPDVEYTFVKGDTCWDLSIRFYGTHQYWDVIWHALKDRAANYKVKHWKKIPIGTKVTIPGDPVLYRKLEQRYWVERKKGAGVATPGTPGEQRIVFEQDEVVDSGGRRVLWESLPAGLRGRISTMFARVIFQEWMETRRVAAVRSLA